MAWRIFLHAIRMVFFDFKAAVRVSAPVIGVVVLGIVSALILGIGPMMMSGEQMPMGHMTDGIAFLVMILFFIAYCIALLWTAVAWHRYALLSEYPAGTFPEFHGKEMSNYLLNILLLGFVLGGTATIASLIGGIVFSAIPVLLGILGVVGFVALLICAQRISIILPAAAIGRRLGLGEAWRATKPLNWTVLWVLLLTMAFAIALGAVSALLAFIAPILGFIADLLIGWLQMLVTLSILTTLYGIAVEGRSID